MTRHRLYEILCSGDDSKDNVRYAYAVFMNLVIIVSIIPLMFRKQLPIFTITEHITVAIFIIDYISRWMVADYSLKKGRMSFLLYPITGWAILDLVSILPGLSLLSQGFKVARVSRMLRLTRILKLLRYTDSVMLLWNVIRKESRLLMSVLILAVSYVFVTALIMYNFEPHTNPNTGAETFATFFDALYWSTVTLTTVGYGDLTPVTVVGRLISMFSALFGVAIIALPSGIITASYIDELRKKDEQQKSKALRKDDVDSSPSLQIKDGDPGDDKATDGQSRYDG